MNARRQALVDEAVRHAIALADLLGIPEDDDEEPKRPQRRVTELDRERVRAALRRAGRL